MLTRSFVSAAVLAAATVAPAMAATQGSLSSSASTGTVLITATVNQLVRISALDDIPLGAYSGTAGLSGSDQLCVYSNTGGYTISAHGSGAGSDFLLVGNSGTATVPYTVQWADAAPAETGNSLSVNTAVSQSVSGVNPTCGGGNNATVIISVSGEALATAPADSYSGTLTLTVAPE
jgi:hypothetical protein